MSWARTPSIAWSLPRSPALSRARCALNTSQASSSRRTVDSSARPLPLRSPSKSVSISWVASESCVKPKVPLPPLIEWAARKIELSVSVSCRSEPSAIAISSIDSRCSWASSKKVAMKRFRSIGMGEALAQDLLHDLEERGRIEGLHQPARGARGAALRLHGVRGLRREQQDRHALVVAQLAQRPYQREPVHVRHVLVRDHEIARGGRRAVQALRAVLGFDDAVARGFQDERDHLAHGGGIVDGQDCFHGLEPRF